MIRRWVGGGGSEEWGGVSPRSRFGSFRPAFVFGGGEAVGFPNAIYRVWGPFMAGKRKRPAIGGRGLLGWRGVIPNISPEASACGRFFDHSAHGRRPPWCRTERSWLGGVVGGRGCELPPEPPLLHSFAFQIRRHFRVTCSPVGGRQEENSRLVPRRNLIGGRWFIRAMLLV